MINIFESKIINFHLLDINYKFETNNYKHQ